MKFEILINSRSFTSAVIQADSPICQAAGLSALEPAFLFSRDSSTRSFFQTSALAERSCLCQYRFSKSVVVSERNPRCQHCRRPRFN